MIRAVIADIDGVIVGKRHGVNFPTPNKQVSQRLKHIHDSGIPVVLCTAKFNFLVRQIILDANLSNPHITDGGALIIDPLSDTIIKKHTLDKHLVRDIVTACLDHNLYTELYGADEYYLQKDQTSSFTQTRVTILQKPHQTVDSLTEQTDGLDTIKIIIFAKNDSDRQKAERALQPFAERIHLLWSTHPAMAPVQGGVITAKGVSKKHAADEVLAHLNVPPNKALGIGDTLGDWNFMNECGYAAVVGDESPELQELAKTKGQGKYFLAPSVDDNGALSVFDYFRL